MASDYLGPFDQLAPMKADFEAGVGIDRVWVSVFEVLEKFERRRDAIMALTGIDETAGWPDHRLPELIGLATAVALQQCIERELISIYVFNGQSGRFHRLPKEGLVSPFISTTRIGGQETSVRASQTSETSWATGKLCEIDCDKSLFRLARERVPLMTSEADASATIEAFEAVLEREAGQPASVPVPTTDVAIRRKSWIEQLLARPRWPVREALLWIALRNLDEMADMVLSSIWTEADLTWGFAGAEWVTGHLHAQREDRTFIELRPDEALMRALVNNHLSASGLFEGRTERGPIRADLWEDLAFGVPPSGQRDASAARRRDQVHGVPWTGHWTGILFERADLFRVFEERPPVPVGFTDDDARDLLRMKIETAGGFLSQDNGADVVRQADPTFPRNRARALTKELTGNEKPGPRGPRLKGAA